ncbi:MAG: putative bifunctional diguanylate cyclase/phosphodiesterase [Acidiferrobacterales bacterium]
MDGPVKDGAYDTDNPAQTGVIGQDKNRTLIVRGKDRRRSESTVMGNEAAVLSREHMATLRENAVHLREQMVQTRDAETGVHEETDGTQERGIRKAEMPTTEPEDQATRIQQVNARLVTATIEAQTLAEQVRASKDKLDYLAHHDALTDLPNRILLHDRLGQAIELASRQGRQLAILFLDLDQFKHINDSLGHAVGDKLLQSVTQRLVGCIRHSDTVSRQGGDEFVLLLPYIDHAEDAALSARKIIAALAPPHHIDHNNLHISASIGISIYPNDGRDAETLLKSADTAMFHAKESGRDNYKFFEQEMTAQAVRRQAIEAGLRRALAQQEFLLHYQPIINLRNGAIVGVETLIRWQHPEHGLLSPAQFVSIAEDCGLILPIGRWVLREACHQARAWQDAGLPPIAIAVNTSALEFQSSDFLKSVRATIEETRLEPRYLTLELTESTLMQDAESTNALLHVLSDLGIKLVVDDFGTGYSSLSYLSKFPIDTLKIDQSFISRMTSSQNDASIVRAVISMGKNLKQRVLAEGIETSEQCAFLVAQQCDEGQGDYFSHPATAAEFAGLLAGGMPKTLL